MSAPAISVIMASYNGAAFIDETVGSLLAQSFRDFELVVVDDCSTDDTVARLRATGDPRIRVLSTACNAGPVAARNLAVAAARGRYLAALDQDDLCHPDRLALQMAYLDAHPDIVLVATAAQRLTGARCGPDGLPAQTTPGLIRWMLPIANPFVWSSVMLRADAARALGEMFSRADREFAEDFDLYHRLSALGGLARLDRVLTTYRCHAGGASQARRAGMLASATLVVEDAHAALGCPAAPGIAAAMTRHIAGREPVPDIACLGAILRHVDALTQHFLAGTPTDRVTRRLIGKETGRLRRRLLWAYAREQIRRPTARKTSQETRPLYSPWWAR